MGLRPLLYMGIVNIVLFQCGDRLYTSESDAYECQIRTSKVDPHTGKVNCYAAVM